MTMPPGTDPPRSPYPEPSPPGPSNPRRWMVLGVSVAVVIAVVAGLVVWKGLATRNDADIAATAAADDGVDRTIGLLREKDPVCDEWIEFADALSKNEEQWAASNRGIPATKWTFEQREIFVSAGEAMATAADQFESILPKARNVVIQELMAQTIVYLRAYVERIPTYVGSDGLIAGVANNFGAAITYMCSAVPLVSRLSRGKNPVSSATGEPAALEPFMVEKDSVCAEFQALIERQSAQLSGWVAGDSMKPAVLWTPKERTLSNAAREVLTRDYGHLLELQERSGNPIMSDLLLTQAAYMEAFAGAMPTYVPDDSQLWTTVTFLGGGLNSACRAEL